MTFTPRFILKNNLSEDINFREPESTNVITIKSKDRAPLHFLKKGNVKQLMLCHPGLNNPWYLNFKLVCFTYDYINNFSKHFQ